MEKNWRPREHGREVVDFANSRKECSLFAFFDANGNLQVQKQAPHLGQQRGKVAYFARPATMHALEANELDERVSFGLVNENVMECMLLTLGNVYVPQLLSSQEWPESVKKDFTSQLHKFMANLTENAYEAKNQTVLYKPKEEISDPKEAAKDWEFVKELESTVIHWTRQVKEVVNQQDMSELPENAGPLEEIEFWRSRDADLGGIRKQLDDPTVQTICNVLAKAKSTYLHPFTKLSADIQREANAAKSNLKFLEVLGPPCKELCNAAPKDIPKILPRILHLVRVLWNISDHYNTPERVIGFLRKISNSIIKRCSAHISLDQVIDGNVEECKQTLNESIRAGEQWRELYERTAKAIGRSSSQPWNFDVSNVFAHIEAFMQRCRDMLDVCEAQMQFSPRVELPAFGGTRGPEIKKSLQDIQKSFQWLLSRLRNLNYDILDVKATEWYEEYNNFKSGVQDFEVMMNNVIMIAFDNAPSLSARIELLEAFDSMARHKAIRQTVEKKAQETYNMYLQETNTVKELFNAKKSNPPKDSRTPRYSGAALWADSLQRRLEEPMRRLEAASHFLPSTHTLQEVFKHYSNLMQSLDMYKQTCHQNWVESLDPNLFGRLEQSLIRVREDEGGLLERNFDSHLLSIFEESRLFQDLDMEIPFQVADLGTRRDQYRVLGEHVLLVVGDYNKILAELSSEERRLFNNRIHHLDSRISPGLVRLNWTSPRAQLDGWIKDARKTCHTVYSMVEDYKESMEAIKKCCKEIGNAALISINPSGRKHRVYSAQEFEEKQKNRFHEMSTFLEERYKEIKERLEHVYVVFQNDSEDVQREWARLTAKVDKRVEDELRAAVRKSLYDFNKAINGDSKNEVQPIFHVEVVLSDNNKVALQPTISSLHQMVHEICQELVAVIQSVPRIVHYRQQDEQGEVQITVPQESFYDIIAKDEEIYQKPTASIIEGIGSIEGRVDELLNGWTRDYKSLWSEPKDAYMRRYERLGKPLSAYRSDIDLCRQRSSEIMAVENSLNERFLHISHGPIKQTLYRHCEEWSNRLLNLLNTKAKAEVDEIFDYMEKNKEEISKRPEDINSLTRSVNLMEKLKEEKPNMQSRFQPVKDMYATLREYEVQLAEEEVDRVDSLDDYWAEFEQSLEDMEEQIEKDKETFREKLKRSVDSFVKEVSEHREQFKEEAPFNVTNVSKPQVIEDAWSFINKTSEKCKEFRERESELQSNMDTFKMPHPPMKELSATENDNENLKAIWGLIREWYDTYTTWKDRKFRQLQVEEMESTASSFAKRIQRVARDVKAWSCWSAARELLDSFRRTMPLITDLRNPALRQRHWNQLMDAVGQNFDPHSDDFTLSRVTELRLDLYADTISELSNNATKELEIEQKLSAIAKTWDSLELDIVQYREGKEMYKLRSADDIFQALEDNISQLSQMKATRFFVTFEQSINQWEQSLSHVSEMIEQLLKVQTAWMYLENIFCGSEDIRKQLPDESVLFDEVNDEFCKSMGQILEEKNALRACSLPGMLEAFNAMDEKLEKIQRSLENYLETKRQQFARFYFISSDDLLELLGQAREPEKVQPHLKGMFEGLHRLELQKPGNDGRRYYESTAMCAPDGETLQFGGPVTTDGRPEDWLGRVEDEMFATVKRYLKKTLEDSRSTKRDKWVRENPGQCIITAGQIIWTHECEKALSDSDSAKSSLKHLKKRWISYLNKLTAMTRSRLSKIDRAKVIALITIEVHARDVIERLMKSGCTSATDFDWVSQLRFYWDKDRDNCIVKQVLSVFWYGYEYQGNNGRLVITPLTDRCYMTLGTAMYTGRGGNPLGPAGTGKTETVKDFGKALARYVIVFNCSDGVDNKMTKKMFSGLAQTGAWACLDEFNRIEVEVLSVVATQIATVMNAIQAGMSRFLFDGQDLKLVPSCGVFVTMNPGYAGRSELPDNLKAILRPVSMMVPDFSQIAEILMFSEGFQSAKTLAKKMVSIMELSQQQLSKQDHYDYGLRSFIIPIARAAGHLKRDDPEASEELLLLQTMRSLIMPKLVYADLSLFQALLGDLFPGVEPPTGSRGVLREAIEAELNRNNLQVFPEFVNKIIQIYECKNARHGNMIVGETGAGKSVAWRVLQGAMSRLKQSGTEGDWQKVHVHMLNPLSLSNDELYGSFDEATYEWSDGVLAKLMRNVCKDPSPDQKWVLFDGPVDTLWIESMNTLLDDNKLLTLLSGERIMMPTQVSLLFEVDDLSQASPATISRAGMIYMNVEDLGWWPYVKSWLANKQDSVLVETLTRCFDSFVEAALDIRRRECTQLVANDDLSAVKQLCSIFDSMATQENGVDPSDADTYANMIEMYFVFCLIWSVGATLTDEGRKRFDMFIREKDSSLPGNDTVYELYIDGKKKIWQPWEDKLPSTFRSPKDVPADSVMVPTIDTVRTQSLVINLMKRGSHVLIIGNVGVGKTMVGKSILSRQPEAKSVMVLNFSAQTTAKSLQLAIEGKMEKRTKGVFAPVGGKQLLAYIDDLNMPKKSVFGFMPPLELLKFWIDYGFWYDRHKKDPKEVKDIQLLTSMAPPGGGRNSFGNRITACFSMLNMANPSDSQLKRIFATLLNSKLSDFDDEIKPLGDSITSASVDVYHTVMHELLPIPSKSHYVFNTRDLARVISGVMRATRQYYDNKDSLLQLWVHENLRVFGDRMWDSADKQWLVNQIDQRLSNHFGTSWRSLFESQDCPPFVNFMRAVEHPPYEAVTDIGSLKRFLYEKLDDYASEAGVSPMDLVLFRDALEHVCRIHRMLSQPKGNALLVGVGGTGRKSLARLAAYVAEIKTFSIEVGAKYRTTDFQEDLKLLFRQTGVHYKETMFLFDESQIVEERFLEEMNNILTSGEVPNLFPKDELQAITEELRSASKENGYGETLDGIYSFFIERVCQKLHLVICMSPIGQSFRDRLRMFPGLVNCCTIDWFTEWPSDALYEVSQRLLENEDLESKAVKDNICNVCVTVHQSTKNMSSKMLQQHNRRNYVTPTNFLDFVNGYRKLLKEKREDLDRKASKLRGGLDKLQETGEQVQHMQGVIQEKKATVSSAKKEAEELLVEIVQDKRVADDQENQVAAESEKIEEEKQEAEKLKQQAQNQLDEAMPLLNEARESLNVLNKGDMTELRGYASPPQHVELCMKGVMTVLKRKTSWENAKSNLGQPSFLSELMNFGPEQLDESSLNRIYRVIQDPNFDVEEIGKRSAAAKSMAKWVHAVYNAGQVYKKVEPLKKEVNKAEENLRKKQEALQSKEQQLQEVKDKVADLQSRYEESTRKKQELESELQDLETKLDRAEKLVNGLAGERTRWQSSISQYEHEMERLPGDVVVAAAFLSYAGPFPSEYREELVQQTWLPQIKELSVPSSDDFDLTSFLADPSDVRDWNIQGLPADSFSTENGVIVTRGWRWTLMIDPQGQATKWVRNMEKKNEIVVLTPNMNDMFSHLEAAMQQGNPVLLQDVGETLDPTLEPLLAKAFVKRGNQNVIKLGDKEVEVDFNFRFYIATKLGNPNYTPEVSTKVALVNFQVKETGLQAQLLNLVVQKERPELDQANSESVKKIAEGKRTLQEQEDKLLDLLANASGSLLDNLDLINTLNHSKKTSDEVTESLEKAERAKESIEATSAEYKPIAIRAASLYFVLNDLAEIDPMYQFSLDSYIDLFLGSISKSPKHDNVQDRVKALNNYHTEAVYRFTTRGLFEAHKLLLSLQMTVRILRSSNQINLTEWNFFLTGGQVLDRSNQPPNPAPHWISAEVWDNITELENVPHFQGVVQSFEQYLGAWEAWYRSTEPEISELPGEWESKCDELQRMVFVRCLRLDRVTNAATSFVANTLGRKFVEPPVLNLDETYKDSTPLTPLIFVLSPGVDPTSMLRQLAQRKNMEDRFNSVALGQGQAPLARKLINDAVVNGGWVFLANCHLMTSWLPELQKIIEGLEERQPHPDFRLWLSSNPTPAFPLLILQRGVKMTTEPPKGIKANLSRLYSSITEEEYNKCKKRNKYPKLLFALSFFHAVLLERRKFRTLGFNVFYDFNDTDFQVSHDVLKSYLDEYEETPWDALRYLTADANYGGRVTDELDRRVLHSYLNSFYCEEALTVPNYRLSPLPTYYIPDHSNLSSFQEYIQSLPSRDAPQAFGQHPNAEISYMREDAKTLLHSCLSLQPKSAGSGVQGRKEERVYSVTEDLLQQVPEPFNLEQVKQDKGGDLSALHVVLFQEIERYNELLASVRSHCYQLQRGIKGFIVMSLELDQMFEALFHSRIPSAWLKAYPSLKPLGSWTRDLIARISQLTRWVEDGYPKVFWLGGFTYPTGFLTAVLQTSARKNSVPIDTLGWEFQIINLTESEITTPPKEGVYVTGIFLEGAGWDFESDCLQEPEPMELHVRLPIIHFKPTESRKKQQRNVYQCPLYMYPIRTGSRERPSYVLSIDLKAGSVDADHWIKRGAAALLSLAD